MFSILKEIWSNLDKKEKNYLNVGLFLITALGVFSIVVMPWIMTREYLPFFQFNKTGPIGDTINGIAGPFIAILASILTFLAFYIQYKANLQQREQFNNSLEDHYEERKKQEMVWRIERFENKFYELLKLHKANVDEMNIDDKIMGRKCFVHMFYELRCVYKLIKDSHESILSHSHAIGESQEIDLMRLAHKIFFYGIGDYSEKQFVHNLTKTELYLYSQVKSMLKEAQNAYQNSLKLDPDSRYYLHYFPSDNIELFYYPFDGHAHRLGHYYRHLYQTAIYVTSQDLLTYGEKYSYMKTVRAQLSNYEQLMLYYNSLASFTEEWREILTRYKLIKNLPLPLADFYISPDKHFEKEIRELGAEGIKIFE